jgi:hypothetical protein
MATLKGTGKKGAIPNSILTNLFEVFSQVSSVNFE